MSKPHYLIGIVLLLLFAGFSYSAFRDTLTPYVPYAEARERTHTVQVAGGLEAGSSSYDEASGSLRFTLVDEETGDTMRVRYQGLKPANFEEAVSIVAIGLYDPATDELVADKLLVKCPSKYQGLEEKTYD
ncbi:MAG: cytochrome c maturation protein CcmE [Acidobacteria bacterium]|nr:MAG: cytochrome c maturation protein CcmE [Acidobacteriota bacterium]